MLGFCCTDTGSTNPGHQPQAGPPHQHKMLSAVPTRLPTAPFAQDTLDGARAAADITPVHRPCGQHVRAWAVRASGSPASTQQSRKLKA
jgi:hypothetical protein